MKTAGLIIVASAVALTTVRVTLGGAVVLIAAFTAAALLRRYA